MIIMEMREQLILALKKLGKYQGYIQTVFKVGYVFKGGEDCET